jgi:ABC-type multidrug transport system fused ATPase/permease subunit
VGDSIRRVTTDCMCVSTIVRGALLPATGSLLSLPVMFTILWQLDPVLTLLSLLVAPYMIVVFRGYADRMQQRSYEQKEAEGRLYDVVEQTFTSIPIVQVFRGESRAYPPQAARGGIGSQTYLKAHGLAARGHEVVVVSQSSDDRRHEYSDVDVRVIRIPVFNVAAPLETEIAQWLTYSSQAAELERLCQPTPPDVLDFPEWGCEGYVYLLNRTERNYIPTAIHLHGPLVMFAHTMHWPQPNSEFYRVGTHMEQTCIRLADAVFSSSLCSAPLTSWLRMINSMM